MFDVWDVFQQGQIRRARQVADGAQGEARELGHRLDEEVGRLEAKIDGLALVCQALAELLVERGGVSEAEIAERIKAIDLRDGQADGRLRRAPLACSHCGRTVHARQRACMYCGTVAPASSLVDGVVNRSGR